MAAALAGQVAGAASGPISSVINGISGAINTGIQAASNEKINKQNIQFKNDFYSNYINQATTALRAAGLPDYTLYTNGRLFYRTHHVAGYGGYFHTPLGAHSDYIQRTFHP